MLETSVQDVLKMNTRLEKIFLRNVFDFNGYRVFTHGIMLQDDQTGDEYFPENWLVLVSESSPKGGFWVPITQLLPKKQITSLFKEVFGDLQKRYDADMAKNPYILDPIGISRGLRNLPIAVAIQEKSAYLAFFFWWGRDQSIARRFYQMAIENQDKKIMIGTVVYGQVVQAVRDTINEQIMLYERGPELDLPLNLASKWHGNTPRQLARISTTEMRQARIVIEMPTPGPDTMTHFHEQTKVVFYLT